MKKFLKYFCFFIFFFPGFFIQAEIIEKIYAVVENEIITYSDYLAREKSIIAQLPTQYQGKELTEKIAEVKKSLLEQMINQKILLAKAKTKNYDVDNDIKIMIDQVKKQYNFSTDEEFKKALSSQGIKYDDYLKFLKEQRMSERLVYEEVEPTITIDTSEIMEYYKNNQKVFIIPKKISLNAIFLNKEYYLTNDALKAKQQEIADELAKNKFIDVANKFTEIGTGDGKGFLGKFIASELDEKILAAADELKKDEFTKEWIETKTGYYLIQLTNMNAEKIEEYNNVREKIKKKLHKIEYDKKIIEFVAKLKEDSYIKIYKID